MAKFMVDGVTYELVELNRFTLGELSALEKVTGLAVNQIARLQETCVCGHLSGKHTTDCAQCECVEFADITPARVSSACMWISMKRQEPGLTFEAACDIGQDKIELVPEPVEAPKAKKAASKSAEPPTSSA